MQGGVKVVPQIIRDGLTYRIHQPSWLIPVTLNYTNLGVITMYDSA
jgi:hypothetical protein